MSGMARRIRFVPKDALVEVSSRTIQGRFLLTPSLVLNQIILGILGRAQRRFGMVIHAFQFLSDHFHMLLSPQDNKQLADFMSFVKGNLAKEAGRLHNWKDRFWSRRYDAIILSNEEEVQVARLKYILGNGCKEGLVASPRKWPGASAVSPLLDGTMILHGTWFDRTREYRARLCGNTQTFPSPETVKLSPLPCWAQLSRQDLQTRVATMVGAIEEETRAMHEREKTKPLKLRQILEQDPHGVPRKLKNSPAPLFIAATRQLKRELREAYDLFVARFREASARLRSGDIDVPFPAGSFPPPRYVPAFAPG